MATAKIKAVKPLQQDNINKVPAKQWRNWPDIAQRVFNLQFAEMMGWQDGFLHPKTRPVVAEEWKTTCWNAAWVAADNVQIALKDIIKGKGYNKPEA